MAEMKPIERTSYLSLFVLAAACGAMSQGAPAQLPDAPSQRVLAIRQAALITGTAESPEARASIADKSASRNFEMPSGNQGSQRVASDFFSQHVFRATAKENLGYRPNAEAGTLGRAAMAASRTFITRDASGRGKLNTSYFLEVLSSALAHTAYRPYWRRSVGAPFSDFGATIGNDAGMNLWREFRPGLEQVMKNHTPKFVEKIEASMERR